MQTLMYSVVNMVLCMNIHETEENVTLGTRLYNKTSQ